jgi:SAM-dependent methyltransferase
VRTMKLGMQQQNAKLGSSSFCPQTPRSCTTSPFDNFSSRHHNSSRSVVRASVEAPERVSTSNLNGGDDKAMPEWTGDSVLSRVVNAAINFPPLFSIMKVGARAAIKGTAEKRSVPWAANVSTLESTPEVFQIMEELENKDIQYPFYYTQPFHGYDTGNLSWQAAFEVEPASDAMALRVYKTETEISVMEAQTRVRMGILDAVENFANQYGVLRNPTDIIDLGCSVGVSTRWLAKQYPDSNIIGLDLSPYMIAVAELRERQRERGVVAGDNDDDKFLITPTGDKLTSSSSSSNTTFNSSSSSRRRITYMHGNMESSGLPDASFDFVSVQFVAHECPAHVLTNLVAECRRLVRPGGMVLIADNNPRSKIIQNLPPVLFTLMKSTEPWSDEYYAFDLEAEMMKVGLMGVVTEESDPRHRAVMGYLPSV